MFACFRFTLTFARGLGVHARVGGRGNWSCERARVCRSHTKLQRSYSAELWGCGKRIAVDFRGNCGGMRKLQTERPNGLAEGRGCRAQQLLAIHLIQPERPTPHWRGRLVEMSSLGLSIRVGSGGICNKFIEFVLNSLEAADNSDEARWNFTDNRGEGEESGEDLGCCNSSYKLLRVFLTVLLSSGGRDQPHANTHITHTSHTHVWSLQMLLLTCGKSGSFIPSSIILTSSILPPNKARPSGRKWRSNQRVSALLGEKD